MSSNLEKTDIGLMHELALALKRGKLTDEAIHYLASKPQLVDRLRLMIDEETVITVDYGIFPKNVRSLLVHPTTRGKFRVDLKRIQRIAIRDLPGYEEEATGDRVRQLLFNGGMPSLDVCIREQLLAEPEKIPQAWQKYFTFFFGSIASGMHGSEWVPGLGYEPRVKKWFPFEKKLSNYMERRSHVAIWPRGVTAIPCDT